MRVYEYAKKFSIPTKTLLEFLKKNGYSLTNHMAVVPEAALALIDKEFNKSSMPKAPATNKVTNSQLTKPTPAPIEQSGKQIPEKPLKVVEDRVKIERKSETPVSAEPTPGEIILEPMMVEKMARLLNKSVSELIMLLLKRGKVYAKNDVLPEKMVEQLATEFNLSIKPRAMLQTAMREKEVSDTAKKVKRLPVIVVMGHVDHGKTTLLDFIRKTRVASREKGGITQHVGAYEANTNHGKIVFLDTPGHEAFQKMRARGAHLADIAILVIAADDSVMPQTKEALQHARSMNVPVIVAINKMDKVDPTRIERVKQDLSQLNLVPEEWGGQTIMVPISAKTGMGVDTLLEMIALQAEIMELASDIDLPARCYVIESRLEKGRGAVATVVCDQGILSVEDFFVCGNTVGKVLALMDSQGNRIKQAYPSIPVIVTGFEELAQAGDVLTVVPESEYRSMRTQKRSAKTDGVARLLTDQEGINIIIKADGNATKEALIDSISKIGRRHNKQFVVVSSGIGTITENDVLLAAHTNALLIGLHIKAETNAVVLAKSHHVSIKLFDVIYHLLEDLEKMIESKREIKKTLVSTGNAVVRKIFNIKDLGVIAGCYVQDGICTRTSLVRVFRGRQNQKIGEGSVKSLQRDKKTVKEVHAGFECALLIDGFQDWQIDDRIECFSEKAVEVPNT